MQVAGQAGRAGLAVGGCNSHVALAWGMAECGGGACCRGGVGETVAATSGPPGMCARLVVTAAVQKLQRTSGTTGGLQLVVAVGQGGVEAAARLP